MNYVKSSFVLLVIPLILACAPINGIPEESSSSGIWPTGKPIPVDESEQPKKVITGRPPEESWNFAVRAGTYVFYAKDVWKLEDDVIIQGYWADGGPYKWAWYDGYRTFSAKVYNPLNVTVKEDSSNQVTATEPYLVDTLAEPNRTMNLQTVQQWEGDSSRDIKFNVTKSPWVINAGYTSTSSISTNFIVTVWKGDRGVLILSEKRFGPFTGVSSGIIEETGYFTIKVESSGCEWWIKAGVEP